jgi:8-oxo-dGTP diphosphatase
MVAEGTLSVALVHRPRYDDWTLPKGKLEPGEQPLLGAIREVSEETGARVLSGRRLRSIEYEFGEGIKRVHYWSLRYIGGEHRPSREVDEVRWMPVIEAAEQLSYDVDRDVLADFTSYPAETTTVLLMRHAKAGRRSDFKGPDALRPLDKIGRRQARDAVPLLVSFGPSKVLAADRLRCEQTVAPLAEALGLQVCSAPEFSDEGYAHDRAAAIAKLNSLLAEPDASVICSQGAAIPGLLDAIGVRRGRHSRQHPARKGSVWAISRAQVDSAGPGAGREFPVVADYYPHPG